MRNMFRLSALAGALLLAVACAKGPAQAALQAAQSKIDAIKPEAEKYAGNAFKGVSDTFKAANDKFAAGDYAGALAAAKEIPGKVDSLKTAIEAKKAELTKGWDELKGSLPATLAAAQEKLKALGEMKKLPAGMDGAKLDAAKADAGSLGNLWKEASAAATAGDLAGAMAKGGEAKNLAGKLLGELGLTAPAAAAAPATAKS